MHLDPDYLRKHYSLLSDEALLAVDRADLVEMAQKILDEEVGRRDLSTRRTYTNPSDEEAEADLEAPSDGDKPAWLEDAAEVYSVADLPGTAGRGLTNHKKR